MFDRVFELRNRKWHEGYEFTRNRKGGIVKPYSAVVVVVIVFILFCVLAREFFVSQNRRYEWVKNQAHFWENGIFRVIIVAVAVVIL